MPTLIENSPKKEANISGSKTPLVSVFIFCKNAEKYIAKSIESVLGQSYSNIEYIIQDGGSLDKTLEIIKSYSDPRIKLISEPDSGPEEGFWKSIRRCSGEFIVCCLSDEKLLPNSISNAINRFLKHPNIDVLTRDVHLISPEGTPKGDAIGSCFSLYDYMANLYCPHFSSCCFRRKALKEIGLYEREWESSCGEFEIWCKLGIRHQDGISSAKLTNFIDYLPEKAAKYTYGDPNQLSINPSNVRKLCSGRISVISRLIENEPIFQNDPLLKNRLILSTLETFLEHAKNINDLEHAKSLSGQIEKTKKVLETLLSIYFITPIIDSNQFQPIISHLELLLSLGKSSIAIELAEKLLKTHPKLSTVSHLLALAYERRGLIDTAINYWKDSNFGNDYTTHSLALIAHLKSPTQTPKSLLEAHKNWAEKYTPTKEPDPKPIFSKYDGKRKIKLGVTCSFWHTDTIHYQFIPILNHLNKNEFEVFGYIPHGYDHHPWIESAFEHSRPSGHLTTTDFVKYARADDLDILIELNGFTPGHRFSALSRRCAPVQISYLNYTSTSAVPNVDYILADQISLPEREEEFFTEDVYRIDNCFFCFTYEGAQLPPISPPPHIQNGYITFGCFGSGGKINTQLISIWSEILKKLPNSKLFIRNNELNDSDNRAYLKSKFIENGVLEGQLIIRSGTNREGVLNSYRAVDISLDTWPYCGGNTIAESLWQGVPVVTLLGERFSSRYGASLLNASGCKELVAKSSEKYIQKALELAQSSEKISYYRNNLRSMVVKEGFADVQVFSKNLSIALKEMLLKSPHNK